MISKQFLLAGEATFTVSNPAGEHYTFRVTKPRDFKAEYPVYFVSLLTGPDNTSDYTYAGLIDTKSGGIRLTQKSGITAEAKSYKVGNWAIKRVYNEVKEPLPEGYKIDHIGECAVCGRALTTPESIELGIGPVCLARLESI